MSETPVKTKELDCAVIVNAEGQIIANGPQQDLTFQRNTYADGTVDIWKRENRPGSEYRLLIPRYDPYTQNPKCRHCGKEL
jgi:hypothetical protein